MKHTYLGNSGLKISQLIYGNWLTHASQIDEKASERMIGYAQDLGFTTFDTADVYANTKAEKVLGKALKNARRESVEILTKVYWPTGPKGPNDCGLSRKHIFESIEGSLRRLRTDYVDLYQAHRFDYETPLEETMQAFADLVRQGKALYIGVSEWSAEQIRAGAKLAQELHVPLVSNQPEYNMLWRPIEAEVVPTCQEFGMSQICFSPLAQGVLTGKYRPGKSLPAGTRATSKNGGADFIARYLDKKILSHVQGLRRVAEEAGCTTAQLALAWVISRPGVAAAIVGATRPEQLKENVKALKVSLSEEIIAHVDETLGDVVQRDPALSRSRSPEKRPC